MLKSRMPNFMQQSVEFFKRLFFKKTRPHAATAWQQLGHDTAGAYWLYAAPVHLVLQRDTFSLAAPVPLPLEQPEIDTLTTLLNTHFGSDGIQFYWHENLWFLRLAQHPQIQTSLPESALNQDIHAFMPTGEGAMRWAQVVNEMQMLLFEHPVNNAREARHLPAMNSLWCYGGGQLPQSPK